MTAEQIVKIAQRYGIGVAYAESGKGGFIFDSTDQIQRDLGDLRSRLFLIEEKDLKYSTAYEIMVDELNLFAA